jgi:DNA-binding LacI/PurR family transcriptional regulator
MGTLRADTQKPYSIHVLMTRMDVESSNPFFRELLRVVESEVHRQGCILSQVWYHSIFSDDKRCKKEDIGVVIDRMQEETDGKGDGLIVIGKCNHQALQKLEQRYKSVVYVNRDSSRGEVDEVICNGNKIASCAVNYLIELGHESIGYVGGCHNEARYKGYIETLQKNGIDLDRDYVIETKQTEMEGFEAMRHFLESDKCPTGIYCSNDITAIGMLKYLAKHKNRYYMPSIISSDGIDEAQYTTPMLTTVQVSREEMGKFAMYLLLDRLRGGHRGKVKIELECKLIKRDSCTLADKSKWCDYYI